MAKSIKSRNAAQRVITRRKILKLQKSGILSPKINPDIRPSKYVLAKFDKYQGVLSGRQAAVKVSSPAKAKELRRKIGEGGERSIVIVPREKGERFKVSGDKISSTRTQYGQKIDKTIGDKFTPPKPGERLYYTLPIGKRGLGHLKRRTFSSFAEMLFYLSKYEIEFDDVKDYIEVERVRDGSRKQKQVAKEYNAARAKLQRARAKANRRAKRGK